jgi:uncharacterized membrane protein (UPF0127 family)
MIREIYLTRNQYLKFSIMKKLILALSFVFVLGLVAVNAQDAKPVAKAPAKTETPAAKKAVKKAKPAAKKTAKAKPAAKAPEVKK